MECPAVLLIIFNRPDTTAQVFEAIRAAKPSRLYIAADAPRSHHPSDALRCAETREMTERIDWPCTVKRLYQTENLGCSKGPRAAFSWFFSQESEGVILEDDCLPHPDFFPFAAAMLEHYRHDQRIISINGSNLGYQPAHADSYSFSRFMNMWGWATWKDRVDTIDYSLTSWRKQRHPNWWLWSKLRQSPTDIDWGWIQYWRDKFDRTLHASVVSWWDWQWIYHQLKRQQLSVVPRYNLVTNIGFHESGTHTHDPANPSGFIPTHAMPMPYLHPRAIQPDFVYEENMLKWVWCYYKRQPLSFHLKHLVAQWIKRFKR
jgi:hypothetical protein